MSRSLAAPVFAAIFLLWSSDGFAQNLVVNPDFVDQLDGWSPAAGASWSTDDSAGGSGSVRIVINDLTSIAITQCVVLSAGQFYEFGADVRIGIQGQATGRAGIVVRQYSDSACTSELDGFPANASVPEAAANDWASIAGDFPSDHSAGSALFEVRATKTSGSSGATLTAHLDRVFLRTFGSVVPDCGDPAAPTGNVTVADALRVLRASVGAVFCDPCYCDVNESGEVSTSDALAVLRFAVGVDVDLHCPAC